MRKNLPSLFLSVLLLGLSLAATAAPPAADVVRFRTQQIDASLDVGYAVALVDVDGDGKKDIVVVDSKRLIWFQNPTWTLRTILKGGTTPDNVCIAPHDIDGDGQVDFALGAHWQPANTKTSGSLHWLKRGKSLDERWEI